MEDGEDYTVERKPLAVVVVGVAVDKVLVVVLGVLDVADLVVFVDEIPANLLVDKRERGIGLARV